MWRPMASAVMNGRGWNEAGQAAVGMIVAPTEWMMVRKAGIGVLAMLMAGVLLAGHAEIQAQETVRKAGSAGEPRPLSASERSIRERCKPSPRPPTGRAFEVFRDCADTPEMVRLPAGRFLMGEIGAVGLTYELPVHEVSVSGFSLGRYEVTFLEWNDCHADGFCQRRPDDQGWGQGFRPVINVSWLDAKQFVAWLSLKTGQRYRLPSEAEWEYAARAGSAETYAWGEDAGRVCDHANALDMAGRAQRPNWFWSNHCLDGYAHTAPVGSFPANAWGLYDMLGNVWEWVEDCWHSDYSGAPTDGSAWTSGGDCGKRVNRGGGWGNHARTLRSAKRDADSAQGYGDAFGFRVARDHAPGESATGEPPPGP